METQMSTLKHEDQWAQKKFIIRPVLTISPPVSISALVILECNEWYDQF